MQKNIEFSAYNFYLWRQIQKPNELLVYKRGCASGLFDAVIQASDGAARAADEVHRLKR